MKKIKRGNVRGVSYTPWYQRYMGAKHRCERPGQANFKRYGGRGIKVKMTIDDVKYLWDRDSASKMDRPSLDRIKNDGHYELKNCRFIELAENIRRGVRDYSWSKRKVIQMTTDGVQLKIWDGIGFAERGSGATNIWGVLNGSRKTSGGFAWKYPIPVQPQKGRVGDE